ncbi:hypothetical protein K5P26_04740 [Sphingopyxis sp. XHP0097]|jgi:hypothetical protein|uniref:Uncharacterized protein n=1 Tax=Sphingopyxis jiangsuensis TaxID=2871171 RepID=A0ABS7MBP0_9SPHN|nr:MULTISPECIES: hypothetical protein [Sphingopyxis]MBL0767824.1 hypothetical protein [Sphingopyxis lutea]MBY4636446.1 hypothetical protein [Sphingopyxis jiangsuensis]
MKNLSSLILPLLLLATPALAQEEESLAQSSTPPQKTSILYTYGDEPCPEGAANEIVVCAQQPESERYRVPKELREELKDDAPAGGGSWASRVEGYDGIARQTRPDSCSAVGSYGFTGCAALALREWFEAKRAP